MREGILKHSKVNMGSPMASSVRERERELHLPIGGGDDELYSSLKMQLLPLKPISLDLNLEKIGHCR